MPLISYVKKNFHPKTREMIRKGNEIISEYSKQGYKLTVRQLYYQFVAHDSFPNDWRWTWTGTKWVKDPNGTKNAEPNYKHLIAIVNDGRLAGYIDWDSIEDRTRNLKSLSHWKSIGEMIGTCADQYRTDKWANQKYRIEVWIEKEALAGVFERVCHELDVPFFSCRGYTSQSEMWSAGMRLKKYAKEGQTPVILHFGDHDPSGMDMTRDISDRIEMFMGHDLKLQRLALNMDQIREYEPPPNPAKTTDSRYAAYIKAYGDESWELDALEPNVLAELVRSTVLSFRNNRKWNADLRTEQASKDRLKELSIQES